MGRILVLLALLSVFSSTAQKEFVDQSNSWFSVTGNHRLTQKWGLHSDFQYRRSDFLSKRLQVLGRIGVEYYLPNSGEITLGYVWSRHYPFGLQPASSTIDENRFWQQFSIRSDYGRIRLQHRYRLEQRFLRKWQQDQSGDFYLGETSVRHRIRYRLQFMIPLNQRKISDKTWFLNISDEVFLGFGKGVEKNVLDQNRIYLGFGYRFDSKLNLQAGYQNQYVVKKDGVQVERNHILQISAFMSLDFRKKPQETQPLVKY
jgi:hypothetical protein